MVLPDLPLRTHIALHDHTNTSSNEDQADSVRNERKRGVSEDAGALNRTAAVELFPPPRRIMLMMNLASLYSRCFKTTGAGAMRAGFTPDLHHEGIN